MKTKMIFWLVLFLLLISQGKFFAMEKVDDMDSPEDYDEIVLPQGTEDTYNTYYGYHAGLNSPADKLYNSFFGAYAGENNEGTSNCIYGYMAANLNSGSSNCILGTAAGKENRGSRNILIGNSTGYYCRGDYNCLIGYQVGFETLEGKGNTIIGGEAGKKLNGGDNNTIVGRYAGTENTYGNYNVFLGYGSGGNNKTGSSNICIGTWSGFNLNNESNRLYIGGPAPLIYGEIDNQVVHINGEFKATATSVTSDQRLKKNIQPVTFPLNKICELNGISFEWKTEDYPDRGLKSGKQIGLIAQDVEKTLPELISEDEYGFKGVSYSKLTVVLVEAVKELKAQNEKQQIQIERLRVLVEDLKSSGI